MTTITEDFVSFETAKLLKEKGFNEPCRLYYDKYLGCVPIFVEDSKLTEYGYKELDCLWESDNLPTYEEACEAAIKYYLENLIYIGMATIKSYTDIEQSKKLADILPLESADMYYQYVLPKSDKIKHNPEIGNPVNALEWYNKGYITSGKEPITLNEYCVPCWSLASLLEILDYPQLSKDKLGSGKVGWMVSAYPDNCRYDSCWHDNPVDACVDIIIKLKELNLL